MNHPGGSRPIVFGEVLFDRFPDGAAVLGGAPFNVAWNLQALGLPPLLISRVGQDALGERIRSAMSDHGLDTAGLQQDPQRATGTVEVGVEDGEPSFDIAPDRAYDHITATDLPPLTGAGVLYHGSLALRSEVSRGALESLHGAADCPVFMDVNLRDPWWRADKVLRWVSQARWVKLNEDELARLVPEQPDLPARAGRLLDGGGIEGLIVTRGERGVWFGDGRGGILEPEPVRAARVVDTVGAGDAFSSVVILGLMRGWSWPLILERAQLFAAAVVGLRGATVTDRQFYQSYKTNWEQA